MYSQRAGEAGLALMNAGLAVWGFAADWQWWLVGAFLALAVLLTALAFFGRHDAPSPPLRLSSVGTSLRRTSRTFAPMLISSSTVTSEGPPCTKLRTGLRSETQNAVGDGEV